MTYSVSFHLQVPLLYISIVYKPTLMIVIYIYSYSVIITIDTYSNLVGGYNHLEKYESQWEGLSHTSWKIKNV
jgi:hypothetical protein